MNIRSALQFCCCLLRMFIAIGWTENQLIICSERTRKPRGDMQNDRKCETDTRHITIANRLKGYLPGCARNPLSTFLCYLPTAGSSVHSVTPGECPTALRTVASQASSGPTFRNCPSVVCSQASAKSR